MGNTECGFSNATNHNVKFQLHSDKIQIIKSEMEIGGGVGVNVPGSGGVNVEANFKSKEEAKHYLVDPNFEGFTTVHKGIRLDLKDHPCASNDTAYITIGILYDDGRVELHTSNFPVRSSSCNYMLGTNESGKNEFVKLHEKRTWRAHGGNGTQNYYGNRVCNGCGQQVRCKRGCSDLAEFGGH